MLLQANRLMQDRDKMPGAFGRLIKLSCDLYCFDGDIPSLETADGKRLERGSCPGKGGTRLQRCWQEEAAAASLCVSGPGDQRSRPRIWGCS